MMISKLRCSNINWWCAPVAWVAVVLACFAVGSAPALAATYYWDNNGTTPGFGTAGGTWGTDPNWSMDSTGVAAPSVTNTTTSDDLNFGSGSTGLVSGAITVGTANAGSLTFASKSGAITLSGGTITFASAGAVTVNNPADTIGSVIAGTGSSLTKSGTGALTLNGANTYDGGTTISVGTVIAGNANALGASGTVTLADSNSGANAITLSLSGNTISRPIIVANQGSGTVTLIQGTFSGPITINRSITFGSNGTGFNGGISGTGDVTIATSSGWSVTTGAYNGSGADNTFTGSIYILSGGILNIGGSGWKPTANLIPDSSTVNVLGTLNVDKGTGNNEIIGALTGNGNVLIGSGTLTVGGGNGTGTFSGVISGGGAIVKIGSGTETLGGTNTYTGSTTITNGTLALATGGSISNSTQINLTSGTATVDVSAVSFKLLNGQQLKGQGQVKGDVTLMAGSRLIPGDTNSVALLTFQNNLTLSPGATNYFELGATNTPGTTYDQVSVGGTLNVGGVQWGDFNFKTNAGFGAGTYVLFHATALSGTLGGTTLGSLGYGSQGLLLGSLSLDPGNGNVLLTVSPFTDTTPPTPNPMTFATPPTSAGATMITMVATTATDDFSPPVQYFFTNTVNGNVSGWQTITAWTDTGLTTGTPYGYQVKARDAVSNETAFSSVANATAQVAVAVSQFSSGSFGWGTDAKWASSPGGPYSSPWISGNNAVFEGSAGTVNVAVAGVTVQNLYFTNSTGYLIQNNSLMLAGTTPTVTVGSGLSAAISSVITGSVGLIKSGAGTLNLNSANTYSGGTTISAGTVITLVDNAMGTSNSITLGSASSGATLLINYASGTIARPITVAAGTGTVVLGGTAGGDNTRTFSGAITLNRDVTLSPANGNFSFTGGISGSGNMTITAGGGYTVKFYGNTFNGDLYLPSPGAGGSILLLSDGNSDIPDSSIVYDNGILKLNKGGNNETIGALSGSGAVTFVNSDTLTVGGGTFAGSATFSGAIGGSGALVKTGAGTQTLSGLNNSYAGATTVNGGSLMVDGKITGTGAVTVASSGTLGGTGLVSGATIVSAGGTLSPGEPAVNSGMGMFTVSNTVTLASNAIFAAQISAGGLADKLVSLGTVSNQNATLSLSVLDNNIRQDTTFTIMSASNIVGTFNGLPEGAGVTVAGRRFTVSYPGNTNVVLRSMATGTLIMVQ